MTHSHKVGEYVRVPLTRGKYTLIDAEDCLKVIPYRWNARYDKYSDSYRAYTNARIDGKQTTLIMHRLIMDAPKGMSVDHINHDTLDNRKANLRLATTAQNNKNAPKRKDNKSGYKGVSWRRDKEKYQAKIKNDNVQHYLGYFDTPEEAALAYNKAAVQMHGEFAAPNLLSSLRDKQK